MAKKVIAYPKQPIILKIKNWTPFTFKNFSLFDTTDVRRFRFFTPKSLNGVSYKDILIDVMLSQKIIRIDKLLFVAQGSKIKEQLNSYLQYNHRTYESFEYTSEYLDTNPKPKQNQMNMSEILRTTQIGPLTKINVSKILPFHTIILYIYTSELE